MLNFIHPAKVYSALLGRSIAVGGSAPHSKGFSCWCGKLNGTKTENGCKGKRSDGACEGAGSTMWAEVMDRCREGQTDLRVEGFPWMISASTDSPLISGLTSSDLDDPCCHGDKTSVTLFWFFLPVSEQWKWMWLQDQHAAILAKNQYVFPLSCIGPVSCNISIHTCMQATLILPACVCCVRFCACEGREKCCLEQKLPSVFELLH